MNKKQSLRNLEQFVRTYSFSMITFQPEPINDFTFYEHNEHTKIKMSRSDLKKQLSSNKSLEQTQYSVKNTSISQPIDRNRLKCFKNISQNNFIQKYKNDKFFKIKVRQMIKNYQLNNKDNHFDNEELNFQQSFQLTLKWKRIISRILDRIIYKQWKTIIKTLEQQQFNFTFNI